MMILSKIVLENKRLEVFNKLSYYLILFLLIFCILLYGQFDGYGQAYENTTTYFYDKYAECVVRFIVHGENTFELIAGRYFYVISVLIIIFIAKSVRKNIISLCIVFLSLLFVAYEFLGIFLVKIKSFYYQEKLFNIIQETILYDVICAFLIAILLLFQIVIIIHYFFGNNSLTTKDVSAADKFN